MDNTLNPTDPLSVFETMPTQCEWIDALAKWKNLKTSDQQSAIIGTEDAHSKRMHITAFVMFRRYCNDLNAGREHVALHTDKDGKHLIAAFKASALLAPVTKRDIFKDQVSDSDLDLINSNPIEMGVSLKFLQELKDLSSRLGVTPSMTLSMATRYLATHALHESVTRPNSDMIRSEVLSVTHQDVPRLRYMSPDELAERTRRVTYSGPR